MSDKKAAERAVQTQEHLDNTHSLIADISQDLLAQARVVRHMHSMLGGLYHLVCGEVRTSLHHFCQTVNQVR
jgi:hypothetical protein